MPSTLALWVSIASLVISLVALAAGIVVHRMAVRRFRASTADPDSQNGKAA